MSILELFFSFKGRIGRRDFWAAYITLFILYISLWLWLLIKQLIIPELILPSLQILLVFPEFAVFSKRLHDRGKSGWWILVGWLPYVGLAWLLVEAGMMPGSRHRNQYGVRLAVSLLPAKSRTLKTLKNTIERLDLERNESLFENDMRRLTEFNDVLKLIAVFNSKDAVTRIKADELIKQFMTDKLAFSVELADEALKVLPNVEVSKLTVEFHARRVFDAFENDMTFLGDLIRLFVEIVSADDEMSVEERALLGIVFDSFDISSEFQDNVESTSQIFI